MAIRISDRSLRKSLKDAEPYIERELRRLTPETPAVPENLKPFMERLDSTDAGDVPALCLVLADWLDERGDPEAEGWMALGRLGKVPSPGSFGTTNFWWGETRAWRAAEWEHVLVRRWANEIGTLTNSAAFFPSRSSALAAAAQAFEGLADEVKREILGNTLEAVT